jgi:Protein of unknown function (DUF3501)
MKRVERSELLDFATFEDRRAALMPHVLAEKAARRVHVGENLTFLFENTVTLRWQIQEMMRAERMVRERDIEHELATYNELLGGPGELGCTLLVEIEDERERAEKLKRWVALPDHVYARLADGRRVPARVDDRQRILEKLSSVQYLKFPVGGAVPVAIGCDFAELRAETLLTPAQSAALQADLAS